MKNLDKKLPRLVWGPVPLINNKYWSNAMKAIGYDSITLMTHYYGCYQKSDFDQYISDLPYPSIFLKKSIRSFFLNYLLPYYSFLHVAWNYDIFHHHFHGGFLGMTVLWRYEAQLIKLFGGKIVITTYGADAYMYSKIIDSSLKQSLISVYPHAARIEEAIEQKVIYWTKHADMVLNGFMIDGMGRSDISVGQFLTINTDSWKIKTKYSMNNGRNGPVKIIHTPNHRLIKGTEFLLQAVSELKKEGYKIELILLENVENNKVKIMMEKEADILVEQLILGYALSAIEGMSSGLTVVSNLSNEVYTRVFRRYSFLNECPIVSATPENIKNILRILIINPKLRKKLGIAGRRYAEKYHSEKTTQFMFGKIYDKIWYDKDVDFINMFHPLKSEYSKSTPYINHPLIENKLPKKYYKTE